MSTEHTPGPWHVAECGTPDCWCRLVVSDAPDCEGDEAQDDGRFVVIGSGELRKHNANLVAAAPDLLEALQAVVKVADRKTVEFDLAHAAIAKATGSTS